METPIKIRFEPERKDYIHASRLLASKTRGFLILAGIVILLIVVSIFILAFPSLTTPVWRNVAAIVCMVGGFYIIYYLIFIPLQLSRTYKKNPFLKETRIFTFNESHIHMVIGQKSLDMDWENFQKVIQSDNQFLLIYKGDEDVYPFIPKRAFEDQAQLDAFLQLFKSKSIPIV